MTKFLNILTNVAAYVTKNVGLIIGIVEAILKAAAGIAALTWWTKKDDKAVAWLESHSIADKIEKLAQILKKFTGFIG